MSTIIFSNGANLYSDIKGQMGKSPQGIGAGAPVVKQRLFCAVVQIVQIGGVSGRGRGKPAQMEAYSTKLSKIYHN